MVSRNIFISICCLFMISCSEYPEMFEPIGEGKLISLTVNTPGGYEIPQSTKSQTNDECYIAEIQVLVFEGGVYKYRVGGTIDSRTATTTTFHTLLRTSPAAVKLYIVANANTSITLNEPAAGGSESAVKTAISQGFTTTGISGNFPMFGTYTLSGGLDATTPNTINNIKMLRAIARIDVIRDASVSNFEIKSVQAFRANNLIQIIPNNISDPTNPSVTAPSVPTTATYTIATPQLVVTGNASTSQLYLPESVAPASSNQTSQATCVILGGRYNGSTETTYYRIDFNSGISGHPFGQILRNYRYLFNITAVNGAGWSTPTEAATNRSSNITAEVKNWDENTTNMVFDGNSYFGVSTRTVILQSATGSSATIDIDTDLATYTLQWCNAAGTPITGTPSDNITNANFSATVASNPSRITVNALTANTGTASRIQYFLIYAGRSKVLIKIEQVKPPDYSATMVNILSIGLQTGSFGSMVPGKTSSGSATGLRPILINKSNFGPTGTVRIGGIWFDYLSTPTISTAFTRQQCLSLMEQYDILNVVWQSNPDAGMSAAIVDWLKGSPHRVLFVTHGDATNNNNLLTLLGIGNSMWNTAYSNFGYTFSGYSSQNGYFTTGPFGAVSTSFSFSATTTGNSMGIKTDHTYSGQLIPLLTQTILFFPIGNILAVDMENRIVFIGDAGIYSQVSGGLKNDGLVNYDQAKLIANIYAWAINQVILPGKIAN